MKNFLLICIIFPLFVFGQSRKQKKLSEVQQKETRQIAAGIKNHVDTFQNYYAGNSTDAANSVLEYIGAQFKNAGLVPKKANDFLHTIYINDGRQPDTASYLRINGQKLNIFTDYFPFPFSANKEVTGMPAMALREKNLPWFADIKDLSNDTTANESEQYDLIATEAARAAVKGATALFVYNSSSVKDLQYKPKDSIAAVSIPVIFITSQGLKKYFTDHVDMLDIEMNVLVKKVKYEYNYLSGFIDNGAASTVIISSEMPAANIQLQNGTLCEAAIFIELAKKIYSSPLKNNNYLFIFSGSNIKFNDWQITDSNINYMLRLSQLTLSENSRQLNIKGFTSFAGWKNIFTLLTENNNPEINIDSSELIKNVAPANIPEVIFFAKNTTDKPDYEKEAQVFKYIFKMAEAADIYTKVSYAQSNIDPSHLVKDSVADVIVKPTNFLKLPVSIGLIRDEKYTGDGLKIKSVTPEKTGAKIGLQPSDILLQLGDFKISDFTTYLQALSHFTQGNTTILKIRRNNKDMEFTVLF